MVWLSPKMTGGADPTRKPEEAALASDTPTAPGTPGTEHPKRPGTQSAVSTTTTGASARARPYNTNLTLIARFDADITLCLDVRYPPALRLFFITEQP
jgi:hypothetical protein